MVKYLQIFALNYFLVEMCLLTLTMKDFIYLFIIAEGVTMPFDP